jgi:exonuclease VII small subunit
VPNAATTTNTLAQLSQHCTAVEDAIKRLEENVTTLSSRFMATEDALRRLEEGVAALSSHCMAADSPVERLEVNVTVLSHLSDTLRTPCQAHQNSASNTGEATQEVNNDLYEVPQDPTISSQDPGSSTSESGTTMNTPAPNRELRQVLHGTRFYINASAE